MLNIILRELWLFGLKQAWACVFGAYLLGLMILTSLWYPVSSLHRYDFLFLAAILFQLVLLLFRLETRREALVIIVFHLVATVMELFKTSDAIASWIYPEDYVFGIGNVPLFTGFMYSAVGSYIARIWRIFDFKFTHYPNRAATVLLVLLMYVNFFTHHYVYDIRWLLLGVTGLMFFRTRIHFRIIETHRSMPLLLGWFLVSLFIYLAENIATFSNIWIYPNQALQWSLVPISKLSAWFMLMMLSFVLISVINSIKPRTKHIPADVNKAY